jgi:hypothetical protein
MDPSSPPKRVTRARAAAKTTDTGIKVATAASKAKATRTMPATMPKRRTRAADLEEEQHHDTEEQSEDMPVAEPVKPRATRGRPKKIVPPPPQSEPEMDEHMEESAPAPALKTRGRQKKVVQEAPVPEPVAPVRTRGRARKVTEEPAIEAPMTVEPPKRIVRGRQATVTKPTAAPKKTVKFEDTPELDKENIIPIAKDKGKEAEATTGLRAKPIRKPPVSARVTRGRAKTVEKEPVEVKAKSPLSPKKATQVANVPKDLSEDELATMEKTPMRPLTKSPLKAPGSIFGTAKKLDFTSSVVVNRAMTSTQDATLGSSIMASPARRLPQNQSPYKGTLASGAKRSVLADSILQSPFKTSMAAPTATANNSLFKQSLLQSPARRPPSPTKVSANGSPTRTTSSNLFGATPRASTFSISRFTTPRTLTKSAFRPGRIPFATSAIPATESRLSNKNQQPADFTSIKPFPGRLSAVLPRHADPVMMEEYRLPLPEEASGTSVDTIEEDETTVEPMSTESMDTDEVMAELVEEKRSTTPQQSPPRNSVGHYNLRPEDEDPFYGSDSEDELASESPLYAPPPMSAIRMTSRDFAELATPKLLLFESKTPRKTSKEQLGFTPLARQLNDWMAPTPAPAVEEESEDSLDMLVAPKETNAQVDAVIEESPLKSSFFEDEMMVRDEEDTENIILQDEPVMIEEALEQPVSAEEVLEAIEFAPTEVDDEDLALVAEAEELSLIAVEAAEHFAEQEQEEDDNMESIVDILNGSIDDCAMSEASQEYGDENSMPIDPALLAFDAQPVMAPEVESYQIEEEEIDEPTPIPPRSTRRAMQPFTPSRVLTERIFHTVSKVPLKAAAAESPMKPTPRKRPASVSRLTAQRVAPPPPQVSTPAKCETPKSNNWSSVGTPSRTPKNVFNADGVLRGAVVYVDVHTSEGADASAVFVELLGQMGARCVKTWGWNPNGVLSPSSEAAESAKVGITHVVFKDGGKRTLEKVRESKGVVCCVGVGWVLE